MACGGGTVIWRRLLVRSGEEVSGLDGVVPTGVDLSRGAGGRSDAGEVACVLAIAGEAHMGGDPP